VIRLLPRERGLLEIAKLGLSAADEAKIARMIALPHGMIVVTGPTGSGKTTTLYAGLSTVNTPEKTIITVEDPVEYALTGGKQVQVNPKTGLTFAAGLRSMVRADPDVIMVGEVRDKDTALIAIESALTGHLVLTTLHTNDAPLAAARLVEMGIEPYLVASGVACVVAQRLVRRLCDCKAEVELSKELLADQGFEVEHDFKGYEPVGCVRCNHTGYRGRLGIYEVMPITDGLRKLLLEKGSADEMRAFARDEGMSTLREDGLRKIEEGVTSVAEVLRVAGSSHT